MKIPGQAKVLQGLTQRVAARRSQDRYGPENSPVIGVCPDDSKLTSEAERVQHEHRQEQRLRFEVRLSQ